MKSLFIAAVTVAISCSAFAEGEPYAGPHVAGSSITRAQVRSDIRSATLSGGELASSSAEPRAITPGLSRAQVRAELGAAVRARQLGFGDLGDTALTNGSMGSQVTRR